ncbi:LysR family transcriptional regulator [Cryptosporangium sp. NPDC051539]|uniref:LysR family transcriptional regulator n=1 Tax=Cryptosporangium sp. NPDC051539 TaxID=3363962 RepID=UPI00379AF96B
MRELISKLSVVSDDAASALRVISHFEALVDQRASTPAMLRAAAALAGCPAGLHARGLNVCFDQQGRRIPVPDRPGRAGVWLDRAGEPGPLDQLIVERCTRSIEAVAEEAHPSLAATRIVCDPESGLAERRAAARQLGLGASVLVVATASAEGVPLGGRRIQLLRPGAAVPAAVAAGLTTCSADDLPVGWKHAMTALRLAVDPVTGGPLQVEFEQLGSLAALADQFDATSAAAVPDVRRVEELRAERPWVTGVIDVVLSHRSIRDAARRLSLHHSTLHQRISWLESQLGYTLLSPGGYARAATTVALWRISRSPA